MSEQTTRTRRTQRGKTSEERAAEVETLAAQLNEGCGRVDDVGEVAGDAAGVGPVHRYSANNVLLLWMRIEQRGVTLTRVTGYRAWQAMGRQVVKGARSFAVLAPVRRRLTAAEAAERASAGRAAYDADGRPALVVRGFRLERVFRYEDTEGQHLPEMPEVGYATGDTPDDAWATLAALIAGHGLRLTAEPEPGDARGHTDYGDRIVNVDPATRSPSECMSWCMSWGISGAGTSSVEGSRGRSGKPRPSRSRSSSARFSACTSARSLRCTSAAGPTATPTPSPPHRPPFTAQPRRC